nr:phage tail protein [Rhizobium sp. Khangiran2]
MDDDDISLADTLGEAEELSRVMADLEARSQRFGGR